MLKSIFWLTIITLIPALELRASIPWGVFRMGNDLSWIEVAGICSVANIILGWVVFLVMGPAFDFIRQWKWFDNTVWPILERTRHRIHPYVEKYGEFGVAVFIGIPLPGSGVYTGAFGSYLLGLDKKKFMIANIIGVLIAAALVSALSLLILHGTVGEESWLAKLFLKV